MNKFLYLLSLKKKNVILGKKLLYQKVIFLKEIIKLILFLKFLIVILGDIAM